MQGDAVNALLILRSFQSREIMKDMTQQHDDKNSARILFYSENRINFFIDCITLIYQMG